MADQEYEYYTQGRQICMRVKAIMHDDGAGSFGMGFPILTVEDTMKAPEIVAAQLAAFFNERSPFK